MEIYKYFPLIKTEAKTRPIKSSKTPPLTTSEKFEKFFKALKWEGIVLTREVLSASIASVVSVAFTQPFDVLRPHYYTLMHSKNNTFYSQLKLFNEILKIYKSEKGISKLYSGHVASQRESLVQTVSMFYIQERIQQQIEMKELKTSFVSGFIAGATTEVFQTPFNAYEVEQKRRRNLVKNHGIMNTSYQLTKVQKVSLLFRGCFSQLMHRGTQYGLRFWFYDVIRDYILRRKREKPHSKKADLRNLNYFESFLAGAASGVFSDFVSNPMEVVTHQLQRSSLYYQRFLYKDTCRNYTQCLRLILSKLILKGPFSTGITLSLVKSMVSVAMQFTVYEKVQALLGSF